MRTPQHISWFTMCLIQMTVRPMMITISIQHHNHIEGEVMSGLHEVGQWELEGEGEEGGGRGRGRIRGQGTRGTRRGRRKARSVHANPVDDSGNGCQLTPMIHPFRLLCSMLKVDHLLKLQTQPWTAWRENTLRTTTRSGVGVLYVRTKDKQPTPRRKDTKTKNYCTKCDVHVCHGQCFEKYHTLVKF